MENNEEHLKETERLEQSDELFLIENAKPVREIDLRLTGGGKKENRRALDFYPTPFEVTKVLMEFLNEKNIINSKDRKEIWEPACGNGAMSNVIKSYGHFVFCSDIAEECDINGVQFPDGNSSTDFLDPKVFEKNVDAIITNPPFDKSMQFIEKALTIAPIVCMLLKSQYWHAKSRYELFNKHKPAYILPLTWRPDFLEHERKVGDKKGAPTMEVAWTVWVKGDTETKYNPLLKPKPVNFKDLS